MSILSEVTTKEHYGLRLAIRLAKTFKTRKPISLTEISEKEKISMKYLEHLIVPFRKAKWVESTRGREGGYVMVKNPANITLKDLISATNGPICLVPCLNMKNKKHCLLECECASKKVWSNLQKTIESAMKEVTLSQLI